ncbi:MAG TPA: hypothetical protein VMS17_16760 [Gemmataceae bacterium]|nr:hypothetical protein [Gemmataceae bacterium]
MSRRIGVYLVASLAVMLAAVAASAQAVPPGIYNRPIYGPGYSYHNYLSPYLNLANGGDPAIQYYLRTLPELNQRAMNQVYGNAIGNLEQQALQPPPASISDAALFTPLNTTGHPAVFGYTGGYFPTPGMRPGLGSGYRR